MGRQAAGRAQEPRVKAMAQRLADEQAREQQETLRMLREHFRETHQPMVMPENRVQMEQLARYQGAEYDREFLQLTIHHQNDGMMMIHLMRPAFARWRTGWRSSRCGRSGRRRGCSAGPRRLAGVTSRDFRRRNSPARASVRQPGRAPTNGLARPEGSGPHPRESGCGPFRHSVQRVRCFRWRCSSSTGPGRRTRMARSPASGRGSGSPIATGTSPSRAGCCTAALRARPPRRSCRR